MKYLFVFCLVFIVSGYKIPMNANLLFSKYLWGWDKVFIWITQIIYASALAFSVGFTIHLLCK